MEQPQARSHCRIVTAKDQCRVHNHALIPPSLALNCAYDKVSGQPLPNGDVLNVGSGADRQTEPVAGHCRRQRACLLLTCQIVRSSRGRAAAPGMGHRSTCTKKFAFEPSSLHSNDPRSQKSLGEWYLLQVLQQSLSRRNWQTCTIPGPGHYLEDLRELVIHSISTGAEVQS